MLLVQHYYFFVIWHYDMVHNIDLFKNRPTLNITTYVREVIVVHLYYDLDLCQIVIFFQMLDFVNLNVKMNYLQPTVCKKMV